MKKTIVREAKTALSLVIALTVLTGVIYPLVVTGLSQLLFPWQANGSLVETDSKIIGSMLIGQPFDSDNYFWGRPSATSPTPYNGASSSGSNLGPTNPTLLSTVQERINHFKKYPGYGHQTIPVDLVTTSASGLDPEISPLAAYFQISRVAKATHLSQDELRLLVQEHIKNRTFLLLGEPRVNVLQLNIALDSLRNSHVRTAPRP